MRHADIKAHLECWRLTACSKLADPTTVIKPRLHTTPRHATPRKVNDAIESALSNMRPSARIQHASISKRRQRTHH